MSQGFHSQKRPFNLKRFAQRQEGIPNTFQPDRRRDPYKRPDKNKGEGKDMLTPGGEGGALGPPDMSSNSLGQNQRFSPLGAPFVGVSQFEDPADSVNGGGNRLPEESLEGSPNNMSPGEQGSQGYAMGTETGHGLKGLGEDINTGIGNVAGTAGSDSPLGIHDTIRRDLEGTRDRQVPFNSMRNTKYLGDVMKEVRRRLR
jgi:hypothetical protein